jgi:hypothetical protein
LKAPNICFITFEYDKTKSEFLERFEGAGKIELPECKSDKIKIREANEPSDLIWQNMSILSKDRQRNGIISFIKILFILCVIFAFMTYLFS